MHVRRPRSLTAPVALCAVALWVVVSVARVPRLVAPPATPVGQEFVPFINTAASILPPDAGYLLVIPSEADLLSGVAPRTRYALYPRPYASIDAQQGEPEALALMTREGLAYILVPDTNHLPPDHWLLGPVASFRQLEADSNGLILQLAGAGPQ